MADHLMVVFSNARPGLEDEFNDWYSRVHIVDIVDKLPGFTTAQRFELSGVHGEETPPHRYLALYWIAEGRLAEAQAAIEWQRQERAEAVEAGREPVIPRRDVFDGPPAAWFFSKVSERYESLPGE